ncbi:MAG: hypothetical protein M1826_000750 [Phylliscum demangeonii]|nr:MAG: hypothetical protein M1826_000750 [Phylliscum demangeonii]
MDPSLLRRKDTTKGPPLRILSLDGGGVRGYSGLILLQELMYRTYVQMEGKAPRRDQIPKPCDHFDLIVGTGTGGLIALMLGRLRMDLETCKDVYVRMTRLVFESDKTIAGIPYRSTLFKASKLEDAIRDCVREHTAADDEGNDGSDAGLAFPSAPSSPGAAFSAAALPRRTLSRASAASGRSAPSFRRSFAGPVAGPVPWGNANALLYDAREHRTKTAVTAVYRGTPANGAAALLRSYDSRKEPAPEFDCTIWQAGRATCATALAFKPIQIGQSVFVDEGAGRYNPAPQVLDEASVNEWPGRDVGVFVSIGTGKRQVEPHVPQHLWWEDFVGGAMGDFAEARRRLVAKIEGCETTHQAMLSDHLAARGVNPQNYYRLNVEVGVGDFGMNEWNRLAEISTSTRRYLAKSDVQWLNVDAATKMAKIHRARLRWAAHDAAARAAGLDSAVDAWLDPSPPPRPSAVELAADDVPDPRHGPGPGPGPGPAPPSFSVRPPTTVSHDRYPVIGPDDDAPEVVVERARLPAGVRHDFASAAHPPHRSTPPSPRRSAEGRDPVPAAAAPALPPKTPLLDPYADGPELAAARPPRMHVLPYPDTDGPPPVVNLARKPESGYR